MFAIQVLAVVVSVAAPAAPQDNVIYVKSCRVTLPRDWIIATHVPNGEEVSHVSVILADSQGQPRADKSLLLYGFCDVSTHAGLTKKGLITANHEGRAARRIGAWELSYSVQAKQSDYALVIDAFRYVEDLKAYVWVRRGRMVTQANYVPTEEDYKEFAPHLERIAVDSR